MVYPDSRTISIIDFAQARKDHLLHDFLRLETEVVTKLISHIVFTNEGLNSELICPLYVSLHKVSLADSDSGGEEVELYKSAWLTPELEKPFKILRATRLAAAKRLADQNDWTEYYECLMLYLLGALKFENLDSIPLSKKLAVLGAAALLNIINSDHDEQMNDKAERYAYSGKIPQEMEERMIRVLIGEKLPIKIYGKRVVYEPLVSIGEVGELTVKFTSLSEPLVIHSGCTKRDWPRKDHSWKFERLIRVGQEFPIEVDQVISFSHKETKSADIEAWWIWHQTPSMPERAYLIFAETK